MAGLAIGLAPAPPESPASAAVAALSGRPQDIHDGDTLRLAGVRVRLWGIDAPELAQQCQDGGGKSYSCGRSARDALERAIGAQPVTCVQRDTDRYGRVVAVCRVDGRDLGEEMVRAGWATAYTRYTDTYAGAEAAARSSGRGIWTGRFQPPGEWRKTHRPPA